MAKVTVYQKPTCTKCRTALRLLKERGVEFDAINYYEQPLTTERLRELLGKLKLSPREVLRKDEPIARKLEINKRDLSDDELITLMVKNPDLIQRPIVVRGNKAVLGRPPENIEALL
ncbi:MAG: arsenate reductase family protein [Pseudomonadota bacterium]|jgi:arsenate reductase|nr:arsenate reductase family protein [Pseudomonadota bacterium]